jgi:hypothetical protein
MKADTEKTVQDAPTLSSRARASDASSETELSGAWREELRRRCREIDEGAVELRDLNDVFARAFSAVR